MFVPQGPLTAGDIEHFRQFGYVQLENCFPVDDGSLAARWVDGLWERTGYQADDPSTWTEGKIHLPSEHYIQVREFAPKVYGAMGQLLGGTACIKSGTTWSDAFVANFSLGSDQPYQPPGPEVGGWHKDGDFFVHFLDSPEQALLVIVLWSDVHERGGPTYIAPDSVGIVARWLAQHPEGVRPGRAIAGEGIENLPTFPIRDFINECQDFRQVTGRAGSVVLMHPFMLHASSQNMLWQPRLITNPALALQDPMCFDRPDGRHSVVEQCVLDALGVESYPFRKTTERRQVVPPRIAMQKEFQDQLDERRRLAKG